jgi:hypothetical protein
MMVIDEGAFSVINHCRISPTVSYHRWRRYSIIRIFNKVCLRLEVSHMMPLVSPRIHNIDRRASEHKR